jgi:hypothetical protein
MIIGLSATDLYPDESNKVIASQNTFYSNLNSSTNSTTSTTAGGFWSSLFGIAGLDGIYNFIINFFSILISFIVMIVSYLLLLIGISTTLPKEFYVFFALMGSSMIIAIVKLIFLSGD